MAYVSNDRFPESLTGSVRGWVPFAERYSADIGKPKPQVVRGVTSRSVPGPPAWEKEHIQLCDTLDDVTKHFYLVDLRYHTSVGRGDRPPHYLKIREAVNDTELVDLSIDIDAREISFNWRRTSASFFVEQHFVMIAERWQTPPVRVAGKKSKPKYRNDSSRRARCKRLQDQFVTNKHCGTLYDRLWVKRSVMRNEGGARRNLRCENIRKLTADDIVRGEEEIAPEQCAEDFVVLVTVAAISQGYEDDASKCVKRLLFDVGPLLFPGTSTQTSACCN